MKFLRLFTVASIDGYDRDSALKAYNHFFLS